MSRPPLDVIGLFAGAPPDLAAAPAQVMPYAVERIARVRDLIGGHVLDLDQPLTLSERGPLALARQGLRLRWEVDVPPGERLPSAVERMTAMCDAGALGIYLPAACKIVGLAELEACLDALDHEETWWHLFVHRYAILADVGVWMHTHGMEHFGYPDLECWVGEGGLEAGERIIDAGVELLMRQGGEALWPGQIVEAVTHEQAWERCEVRRAPPVEGHDYGPYGALELVLGADDPGPGEDPPP